MKLGLLVETEDAILSKGSLELLKNVCEGTVLYASPTGFGAYILTVSLSSLTVDYRWLRQLLKYEMIERDPTIRLPSEAYPGTFTVTARGAAYYQRAKTSFAYSLGESLTASQAQIVDHLYDGFLLKEHFMNDKQHPYLECGEGSSLEVLDYPRRRDVRGLLRKKIIATSQVQDSLVTYRLLVSDKDRINFSSNKPIIEEDDYEIM